MRCGSHCHLDKVCRISLFGTRRKYDAYIASMFAVVWMNPASVANVGDIVCATIHIDDTRSNKHHTISVVKRILGVGGDVIRNLDTGSLVVIPKGYVWLQGDNVEKSRDSRHYGPVPEHDLQGVVQFQVWPRIGRIPKLDNHRQSQTRLASID